MQSKFMRRALVVALGSAGGLAGQAYAGPCANAYEKAFPYTQPLADDHAKINLHNTVTLRYDCKTFLTETSGGVSAEFYGVKADLIDAKVSAVSARDHARLGFSALVLGFEIAHEDRELKDLYQHSFKPDHDLDLSQDSALQVGPLSVPVRYGVQGTGALEINAGMRNLGVELAVMPTARANAYLQAGLDVKIIKASAFGDLLLVNGKMTNSFGVHFAPNGQTPTIAFSAVGDVALSALNGAVSASVEVPEDGKPKTYKTDLFHWDGYNTASRMYERSETIADLPR